MILYPTGERSDDFTQLNLVYVRLSHQSDILHSLIFLILGTTESQEFRI